MRLAVPLLSAAALLAALAGPAQAKEVVSARACDTDGCRTITAAAALRGLQEGGDSVNAPKRGAPFYRVHLRIEVPGGKDFRYTQVYVPSPGLLRYTAEDGGYGWVRTTPRGQRAFERLTRGLEPLPARRLRGVGVKPPQPAARVDEVVPPPPPAPDAGGFAWTLLPLAAALLLGAAAWAVRRRAGPPAAADVAASRSR